jgi:Uma2 family endonuclease
MPLILEPGISTHLPAPHDAGSPLLVDGQRLSRGEFERRYAAMPEVKKAELIEGRVFMPSPTRLRHHATPHAYLAGWLFNYHADTPGTTLADNTTVRLEPDSEPQPDLALLILPEFGGRARISDDDYLELGGELFVEVAASTASYDLHEKRRAYQRSGVCEYLVWRTEDRAFDWLVLRDGVYAPLAPERDGILRSEVFPGLWLDPAALLAGDLRRVRRVLEAGVTSSEHGDFVAELAARAAASCDEKSTPILGPA